MTDTVEIFEVGPRDGLQNEAAQISTADKIALVNALADAGLPRIEVASFVSPKWVPQMADGAAVVSGADRSATKFYGLVPNARGLHAATECDLQGYGVFIAASDGFSRANTNVSAAGGLDRAVALLAQMPTGIAKRGYISCVTDCPYDGVIAPATVAPLAQALLRAGCDEISLGDTLGRATTDQIDALLAAVTQVVPADKLAGHYHDTAGGALDNIDVSLGHGLRVFDTSIAGLGGCPYAPGAAGNVDTQLVYDPLRGQGYQVKGAPDGAALDRAAKLARSIVAGGAL